MAANKEQRALRALEQNGYRELETPLGCCYNCKHADRDYDGDLHCGLINGGPDVDVLAVCDKYERTGPLPDGNSTTGM